jgi:alcohol dehydrogenase class IV
MKDLNLKTKLSDFGISKKQLENHMEEIISFTISDTGSLVNPRELTEENIIKLCKNML